MSQSPPNDDFGQVPVGVPGGLERAREVMIHEYIKQARARLQAASATTRTNLSSSATPRTSPPDTLASRVPTTGAADSQLPSESDFETAENNLSAGSSQSINPHPSVLISQTLESPATGPSRKEDHPSAVTLSAASADPTQFLARTDADVLARSAESTSAPSVHAVKNVMSKSATVSPFPAPPTSQSRPAAAQSHRSPDISRSAGADWPLKHLPAAVAQAQQKLQQPSYRSGADSSTSPAPATSGSLDAYSNSFPAPPSAHSSANSPIQGLGLTLAGNTDRPSANAQYDPTRDDSPQSAGSRADILNDFRGSSGLSNSNQHIRRPLVPNSASTTPLTAPSIHTPVAFRAFAHSLQLPSVPVIPEETDGNRSARSSRASNTTDLLYEGSENGRVYSGYSDFLLGYEGRDSGVDQDASPTEFVEQASVGQRQKPIIRNVSIGSRTGEEGEATPRSGSVATSEQEASHTRANTTDVISEVPLETAALGESTNENQTPSLRLIQQPLSPDFPRSPSPGNSRNSTPKHAADRARSRSPLIPASSRFSISTPRKDAVSTFGGTQVTESNNPGTPRQLEESERPHAFDASAVKDEDMRASTTSIKTLILRNMKLASNLERGVTSSKFGLDWIINAGNNNAQGQPEDSPSLGFNFFPEEKSSDVPHAEQPVTWTGTTTARSEPDMFQPAQPAQRRRRQCCGLPLWGFILTMISILLLAAAAILVPVGLIVIPGQNNDSASGPRGNCQQTLHCGPHGSIASSFAHDTCHCICTDGFTGQRCNVRKTSDCATATIAQYNKATVGSNVLPVLKASKKMSNIALDEVHLLSLFSSTGISCKEQNKLVSFQDNALAARTAVPLPESLAASASSRTRMLMTMSANASLVEDSAPGPVPPYVREREEDSETAMTNGIIVARSSTPVTGTPSPVIGMSSAPTMSTSMTITMSTSTTATPSAGGRGGFDASSKDTLVFARIAVLYVFQSTSKLPRAMDAHTALEKFLAMPSKGDPTFVNLGNGWRANLVRRRVWYSGTP